MGKNSRSQVYNFDFKLSRDIHWTLINLVKADAAETRRGFWMPHLCLRHENTPSLISNQGID